MLPCRSKCQLNRAAKFPAQSISRSSFFVGDNKSYFWTKTHPFLQGPSGNFLTISWYRSRYFRWMNSGGGKCRRRPKIQWLSEGSGLFMVNFHTYDQDLYFGLTVFAHLEWIDNGQNKRALQEAEKVLKKQPDLTCAKVINFSLVTVLKITKFQCCRR